MTRAAGVPDLIGGQCQLWYNVLREDPGRIAEADLIDAVAWNAEVTKDFDR